MTKLYLVKGPVLAQDTERPNSQRKGDSFVTMGERDENKRQMKENENEGEGQRNKREAEGY